MKTMKNTFALAADRSDDNKVKNADGSVLLINGESMFQSLHYEEYRHTPRKGVIVGVPDGVNVKDRNRRNNYYDTKLEVGDTVWFHHLALMEEHSFVHEGKRVYRQEYEDIYAVEKGGEVIPLERYIFIEPIAETDEDVCRHGFLIKPVKGVDIRYGKVAYINARQKEALGVDKGDVIMFEHNSDYPLLVEGRVVYRTLVHKILCRVISLS